MIPVSHGWMKGLEAVGGINVLPYKEKPYLVDVTCPVNNQAVAKARTLDNCKYTDVN
jgi:hypothetical protein